MRKLLLLTLAIVGVVALAGTSSAFAASSGPNFATDAYDIGSGWSSEASALTSNNSCASETSTGEVFELDEFNFNLPNTATITGVKVDVEYAAANSARTASVRLVDNNTPVGSSKTLTSAAGSANCSNAVFVGLGADGDMWGTSLTVSDIEDPDFGVRITSTGSNGDRVIDSVRVTIYYTEPATEYTLTVSKAGTGTGTVVSDIPADISCGADCSDPFTSGSLVELFQTADPGSTFTGWSGACTGTGSCFVTMDAAKSVTATFDLIPEYTLSVTKAGTGSGYVRSDLLTDIDCGVDCSDPFTSGSLVELFQVADLGSTFVGWSGACTGTGSCFVTMDAAKSVTATFDTTPSPTGSLEITKYICPAETALLRSVNGVGGSVPEGCILHEGAYFAYVYNPDQSDANAPYPELAAPITAAGVTNGSGVLTVNGLLSAGRYLIVETDADNNKLANGDILNLYCEGDGESNDSASDNQELTFVPEGGTAHCVAYNKAPVYECSDTIDNDEDGFVDYNEGGDPDCTSATDNTEETIDVCPNLEGNQEEIPGGYVMDEGNCIPDGVEPVNETNATLCGDGQDNDFNGYTDLNDASCASFKPEVHFTKTIVADNVNGLAWAHSVGDFLINFVRGDYSESGSSDSWIVLDEYGTFDVSEIGPAGYAATYGGACEGGTLTINPGEEAYCTIENNDLPQCSNGLDDDGDGRTDDSDGACSGAADDDEGNDIFPGGGQTTGSVLGASTDGSTEEGSGDGKVAGAIAVCELYLPEYIKDGNDPKTQYLISKLQVFLNEWESAGLKETGVYDEATIEAVKKFQLKYADEILTPWGLLEPTGWTYITTTNVINRLIDSDCAAGQVLPELIPFAG